MQFIRFALKDQLNWSVAREYIDRVESARAERNHKVAIVQVGEPLPEFAVTDSQGTRFSVRSRCR